MMPAEAERERLAAAIAASGYACVECGSQAVSLDHSAALGWVPVIHHRRLARGSWYRRRQWCPCTTSGSRAAGRASIDLLDALVAVVALGDYAEPVIHRRERVTP